TRDILYLKHRKKDAWPFLLLSFAIAVAPPTEHRRYFAPPVDAPCTNQLTAPSATLSPACWYSSTSSINATASSNKSAREALAPSIKRQTHSSATDHSPSRR